MLLVRRPLLSLAYIITTWPSVTWASLPRIQPVPISTGAAYALPPALTPSLAPGWSPIPPVWSTPTAASTTLAPPEVASPTHPSECIPYQCNVFYQWVDVLYWPQATQNTACLPQPTGLPAPALPPGIARDSLESPSVYVIFPSISANDGCTQVGNTYSSITTSFAPYELSTIDSSGATKVFDYGDLPCGPPGVNDPSYAPLIAPPSFIFNDLDSAFTTCIPGAKQGIDPPTALPIVGGNSGPGRVGHPRRNMRMPARAPAVPTPQPT